jgi:hypothetical protein
MSVKLTAETKVALDLAVPASETAGIRERRPHVSDAGVQPVFHAHDPHAIG